MNGIAVPTLHSGGTSAETLLDGYEAALDALRLALARLDDIAPNGRDYYVGPTSLQQAEDEHIERRKALCGVIAQIEQIHITVYDAQLEQEARRG